MVLVNVLKLLLGNDFTEDSQAAWTYAWNGVSQCITECLNIGSSLITVALVRFVSYFYRQLDPIEVTQGLETQVESIVHSGSRRRN